MFSRKPKCPECNQKGKHLDKCSFYTQSIPEMKTPLEQLVLENKVTSIRVFDTTAKSLTDIRAELRLKTNDAAVLYLIANYRRSR